MNPAYEEAWKNLLEQLDDTSVSQTDYKDALEEMVGELQSRLSAVKDDLNRQIDE